MNFYEKLDDVYATGGDVEAYLKETASTLEAEGKGDSDEFVMCMNELGSLFRGLSRFEESITAFSQALDVLKGNGNSASPNYATTINNMATAYRMMGDNKTAKEMYFEAKDIYDSISEGIDDYIYAGLLNNISALYLSENDLALAEEYLKKGILLLERHPEYIDEVATSKTNLSSIFIRSEEYKKAEQIVEEAILLFEQLPYESGHYAMAQNNQAVLKAIKEDYEGAIEIWEKVLVKIKEMFSENADYAFTSRNVATLYSKIGNFDAAEKWMEKALEIFIRIFPADDGNTLRAKQELEVIKKKGVL